MISNPVTGAIYFFDGLSLLKEKGIKRFVLIPLLINIAVFSLALRFALSQFSLFIDWALSELPGWLDWLEWILWPLFAVTFYGLVFFTSSLVANIIAAPFNAPLAAAVERHLGNTETEVLNRTFSEEVKIALSSELQKLKHSLYLMMPLLFLSLLSLAMPLISPAVAVLWLIYSVWILTLEYADYPMTNHGMAFRHIREKLAEKRILSLGFGSAVMLATMIPFVNFLVIPVAVAGATVMYAKEFK